MVPADQKIRSRSRVIIADDNKEMRDTVCRILSPEFEVVSAVADGRALVDAVSEFKPDVGIIDISMPILNGIQAAAEIKSSGSQMKVVFLTINEDDDFVRAAFESGASGYVVKRQMASDLAVALKEALAGCKFVSAGFEIPADV